MSLTGILFDVSCSMRDNIGSGTNEEGGPWIQPIFKVIYDLIQHDASEENCVFAIGVGGNHHKKEIFDIVGTLQQLDDKGFDIFEGNLLSYLKKDASPILKAVEDDSIVPVQHASRIIRGLVDKTELSKREDMKELLKNVEPLIYGETAPLFESLDMATKLFERDASANKLLFVLSNGKPTDGSNEDSDKIKQITSKLTKAGVTIISCFITKSTEIDPKHLFDEMQQDWETGAKFLFSLSSKVPTQYLPRAILMKRGWTIDITKNETKLFLQVNHPDNLRY